MNTNYTLSHLQEEFLKECSLGKNLFLTGKAGTGKSFIIKEAIRELTSQGKRVVALAPTGVAAHNIQGQTMHSLFSLPIFGVLEFSRCSFLSNIKKDLLREVDVLIIDEVSMLRPDILDAIHWTLITNKIKGGLYKKQVIFVGDLKQLPSPIDSDTLQELLKVYPNNIDFYSASIYSNLAVETINLDVVHRQSDPEFIKALNVVRDGGKDSYFEQFVVDKPKGIILAPHNSTVQGYNTAGLKSISSSEIKFEAIITGKAKASDFSLEENLILKSGCKVMYLVNDPDRKLFNGILGTFIYKDETPYIEIDGVQHIIESTTMSKHEYAYDRSKDKIVTKEVGSMSQLPVKLAYALTIHKSQGLTFDEMTLDLSRPCFEDGQLYTALSRARGPEGLNIKIK